MHSHSLCEPLSNSDTNQPHATCIAAAVVATVMCVYARRAYTSYASDDDERMMSYYLK